MKLKFKKGDLVWYNRGTYGAKTFKARIADVELDRKYYLVFINEGKAKPTVENLPFDTTKIIPRSNE